MVFKLSRLGSSVKDVLSAIEDLSKAGVSVRLGGLRIETLLPSGEKSGGCNYCYGYGAGIMVMENWTNRTITFTLWKMENM